MHCPPDALLEEGGRVCGHREDGADGEISGGVWRRSARGEHTLGCWWRRRRRSRARRAGAVRRKIVALKGVVWGLWFECEIRGEWM